MEDNIIIDGIDVSGCDRYIKHTGYIGVYNTFVKEGECKLDYICQCKGSKCEYKLLKKRERALNEFFERNTNISQ